MKGLLIGGVAVAIASGFAPALAQVAPPPGVAQGTAPAPQPAPRARMMVMSNRVMSRDEVVTHVRDMFARLDTNRDGFVTKDEVAAVHQKMTGAMGMTDNMRKRVAERGFHFDRSAMFDRLDANHDGSISRQEFTSAQPQVRERRVFVMRDGNAPGAPDEPRMKMRVHRMGMGFGGHMFDTADANHDGRVSLAEAQAAALAHFDRADLNHDGRITPDERAQARQYHRDRKPS